MRVDHSTGSLVVFPWPAGPEVSLRGWGGGTGVGLGRVTRTVQRMLQGVWQREAKRRGNGGVPALGSAEMGARRTP